MDGRRHTLASSRGPNGLAVMSSCNHCPYAQAMRPRIERDVVAIMSNDPAGYSEDSFEQMERVAKEFRFPVPCVLDETHAVARA